MVIKLEPYQGNAAIIPRVYPVQPMHQVLANRAVMRAYATKSSNQDSSFSGIPSCTSAGNCECCNNQGQMRYKGPTATVMGNTCANAEKYYTDQFGKCNTSPETGQLSSRFPAGGPKPVTAPKSKSNTKSKSNSKSNSIDTGSRVLCKGSDCKHPESGKTQGKDDFSDLASEYENELRSPEDFDVSGGLTDNNSDTGSGGDTTDTTTPDTTPAAPPTPAASGVPQDLFASIPQVSKFFNDMYAKVCTANTKIPFVCESLAYFEIGVIVVIVVSFCYIIW